MKPNWPLILRQIMAQTQCTYEDIARQCGCSKSAVDQWHQGVKRPNFENGWELLNAYTANVSTRIPQI